MARFKVAVLCVALLAITSDTRAARYSVSDTYTSDFFGLTIRFPSTAQAVDLSNPEVQNDISWGVPLSRYDAINVSRSAVTQIGDLYVERSVLLFLSFFGSQGETIAVGLAFPVQEVSNDPLVSAADVLSQVAGSDVRTKSRTVEDQHLTISSIECPIRGETIHFAATIRRDYVFLVMAEGDKADSVISAVRQASFRAPDVAVLKPKGVPASTVRQRGVVDRLFGKLFKKIPVAFLLAPGGIVAILIAYGIIASILKTPGKASAVKAIKAAGIIAALVIGGFVGFIGQFWFLENVLGWNSARRLRWSENILSLVVGLAFVFLAIGIEESFVSHIRSWYDKRKLKSEGGHADNDQEDNDVQSPILKGDSNSATISLVHDDIGNDNEDAEVGLTSCAEERGSHTQDTPKRVLEPESSNNEVTPQSQELLDTPSESTRKNSNLLSNISNEDAPTDPSPVRLMNCPHCLATSVLPIAGHICPNCKRRLDEGHTDLHYADCLNCGTKAVLPMKGNICPNCKKPLM